MLPDDIARCAGFISETSHTRCDRRFDCARFLSRAGAQTPFTLSACEGGDRFIHVSTVADATAERHPYVAPPVGVLGGHPSTHTKD